MRKIIFVIFSLIYAIPAMALNVSGTVVDENNEPLIGATVYMPGTTKGFSIYDPNGKFSESIDVSETDQLEVSFMGCQPGMFSANELNDKLIILNCTQQLEAISVEAVFVSRPCNTTELTELNATAGSTKKPEYSDDGTNAYCNPTACKCGFDLNKTNPEKNTCDPWPSDGKECKTSDEHASLGYMECIDDKPVCKIEKCKVGYKLNGDKCVEIKCPCGQDFDEKTNECVAWTADKKCTKLPKNAKSGKPVCRDGIEICEITECDGIEFDLDTENNQCKKTTGDECTSNDKNAKKAKLEKRNKEMICVIKTCNKGYTPSDDGLKCEQSAGDCSSQVSQIDPNATKGEYKKKECRITECKNGYDVDNNKCVPISGNCKKLPENALRGTIKFDDKTQSEICLVSHCKAGFKPSDDKKSCIADQEEQNKMDELRDNYEKTKANEQSLANRTLGAASMATMGLGAMQAASAKAEKNVYEDVEQDMASYLATFRCDFGTGKRFQGGEKNIQIPGTAELIPLYSEYVNLANDLKARKEQLGMRAGIESEKILDSATTGLYDDVSSGITSGVYASLSRALMNPDGEDAKKWAEMKGETDKQLKQGLTAVGIGAVVGVAGNAIINHGFKEKSQEILNKYKKIGNVFQEIKKSEPVPKCSDVDGATGTDIENCTCRDKNKVYQGKELGCVACENGKIPEKNKCVCPPDMVEIGSKCQKKQDAPVTPDNKTCELTGLRMEKECKCVEHATADSNVCECIDGYENIDGVCTKEPPQCNLTGLVDTTTCKCIENATQNGTKCECSTPGYKHDGNKCVANNTPAIAEIINPNKPMFSTQFNSDALFESGKSTLTDQGKRFLQNFQQKLDSALADAQSENPDITFSLADVENYCIKIVGHTDRTKFKNDPTDSKNQKLSEDRANTIKQILISGKNIPDSTITTSGMGPSQCTVDLYPKRNDPKCRRVDVEFWAGSCQNLKN